MFYVLPAKLPEGITIEKLLTNDYVSSPRNKQIAGIFKEAGLIEKYGSGIRRIREAFRKAGCKEPLFEEISGGFRVIAYATPPVTPPVTPQIGYSGEGSSKPFQAKDKILAMIKHDPRISLKDIADQLGIRRDTAKEYISQLKRQGQIRRVGKTSAGHWEIINEA